MEQYIEKMNSIDFEFDKYQNLRYWELKRFYWPPDNKAMNFDYFLEHNKIDKDRVVGQEIKDYIYEKYKEMYDMYIPF